MRIALLSVALILSAPALANDNAASSAIGSQEVGVTTEPAKESKKVCRRQDTTESRLSKKLCLTADEWKQRDRNTEFRR